MVRPPVKWLKSALFPSATSTHEERGVYFPTASQESRCPQTQAVCWLFPTNRREEFASSSPKASRSGKTEETTFLAPLPGTYCRLSPQQKLFLGVTGTFRWDPGQPLSLNVNENLIETPNWDPIRRPPSSQLYFIGLSETELLYPRLAWNWRCSRDNHKLLIFQPSTPENWDHSSVGMVCMLLGTKLGVLCMLDKPSINWPTSPDEA